jgi:parallel beta-helix repeat protein
VTAPARPPFRWHRVLAVALVGFCSLTVVPVAFALQCGGATPCLCGDTVTADYAMTSDLGPCPRVSGATDTIGLALKPGVTLDCQGHTITGPADDQKDAFGIRVGNTETPTPDSHVVVRQCGVTGFWWGIYVQNAQDVLIEDNHLHDNGWKVPVENGSGYGLDVANSQGVTVRGNLIADNGNEGFHLSGSSSVTVDGNVLVDNGFEQLYLIHADDNIIRNNRAEGGTQGLEMRYSSNNAFSYNVWAQSPAQILENDNSGNTFYYDSFEGRVVVGAGSSGNVFQLSAFTNPTGACLTVDAVVGTYVYKGHFRSCASDLVTTAPVTLDRSVNNLATVSKSVTVRFPGCTADIDLDANVGDADRQIILAAMGSVIGDPSWNPEADLDHDGDVDAADRLILESQLGPCAANLVVTAVSNPPATAAPGTSFSVTDTVQNSSRFAAGTSRTQYYLSLDALKDSGDKLLGGRSVPALAPNGISTGTVSVLVPASTPAGTYLLLACADDLAAVAETDETDNCRPSTATVQVGRPDLTLTSLSEPPPAVALGGSFAVTDTVLNQSAFPAGASRIQYYLSLDSLKNTGDRLLTGSRAVPSLAPGAVSTGTVSLTVPTSAPAGTYLLLACVDDTGLVVESDETNNCRASASSVQVGKPDLAVTAVSDPLPALVPGGSFTVTDTVRNQSAFSAPASRAQYYLSLDGLKNGGDRLLSGYRSVPSLAPGAESTGTITVTVPSGTPLGTYFLLACADDTGAIAEADETNNCRASVARIQVGRPDLVAAAVSDPPAAAAPGSSFLVTDTVRNQSVFPAGASRVQYYLSLDGLKNSGDRLLTGSRAVPSLPAGIDSTGTVSLIIPAGTPTATYYLLACADDAAAVVESNETNNCRASVTRVAVAP